MRLYEKDGGFTTIGMAVAIMVSVALVAVSIRVYRVNALTSEIQDVADAAALAAENEVAEFVVIARACDAIVLSFSLTGVICGLVGTVLLCVPGAEELSEPFINAGTKILKIRDQFSKNAAKALNTFQKALPYLAAVSAYGVAAANNNTTYKTTYMALAILCPSEGAEIGSSSFADEAGAMLDEVSAGSEDLSEEIDDAEDVADAAAAIKEQAYNEDCGDYPEYCLYERASSLAGLSGADNPYYASVDAWSFSVPLERAKAYYQARATEENELAYSSETDRAKSALRKRYYQYGVALMGTGYVYETSDSFSAYFPVMPKTKAELKETSLYTEAVYPVTLGTNTAASNASAGGSVESGSGGEGSTGTVKCMHAYAGCAAIGAGNAIVGYGSIRDLEENGESYEVCPYCGFSTDSLSRVGAASSVIDNGFEVHYREIAELAEDYESTLSTATELNQDVQDQISAWANGFKDLLATLGESRIEIDPPGATGVIVVVVDTSKPALDTAIFGGVVDTDALGMRVAVSAATIIEEGEGEGSTVITAMTRLVGGRVSSSSTAISDVFLRIWSSMLGAYSGGQKALQKALESVLNGFGWFGGSLGTWAAELLEGILDGIGLQPADINMVKPVLINTGYVAKEAAEADSDTAGSGDWTQTFCVRYISLKETAAALADTSGYLQDALTSVELSAIQDASKVSGRVEIVTMEMRTDLLKLPSFCITITLTQDNGEDMPSLFTSILQTMLMLESRERGEKVWH